MSYWGIIFGILDAKASNKMFRNMLKPTAQKSDLSPEDFGTKV